MAKGLYFYKTESPYKEDVTKACKLTITEIDSNFLSLKDMDIKDLKYDVESHKLIAKRNGVDENPLVADLSSLADFDVDFDKCAGTLKIRCHGKTVLVAGLITENNLNRKILTHVHSDSTLNGLGTVCSPLTINPLERTGQYKPCKSFVDLTRGEILPCPEYAKKGERYLTREVVNEFGYLYNFKAVEKMSHDLGCEWRIPTKSDWDSMLNAIEPCEKYRTHNDTICNVELGKYAGKFLKSARHWVGDKIDDCDEHKHHCHCDDDEFFDADEDVKYHFNKHDRDEDNCVCYHHHEHDEHHPKEKPLMPHGIDMYGMHVVPAGYGDGCAFMGYFAKRGAYWSSTMINNTDVYVKRFDYNKTGVVQIAENPRALLSIRLMKDYDGTNFNEVEIINGQQFSCVLIPSLTAKTGYSIWTVQNVGFHNCEYHPTKIEGGCDMSYKAFFTTEWDGRCWIKKPLMEGESVVLLRGLKKDEEYAEYRLVKGRLVSVTSQLYTEIMKEITEIIERIEGEIEEEKKERKEADEILEEKIEELSGSVEELQNEVIELSGKTEQLEEDVEELSGSVEELQNEVIELSGKTEQLEEDVETLRNDLEDEISARTEGDEILSGMIEDVASDLAKEIDRATKKENEIEGRLISKGEYLSETGVLTLVRENQDTIVIQLFNGDYGKL